MGRLLRLVHVLSAVPVAIRKDIDAYLHAANSIFVGQFSSAAVQLPIAVDTVLGLAGAVSETASVEMLEAELHVALKNLEDALRREKANEREIVEAVVVEDSSPADVDHVMGVDFAGSSSVAGGNCSGAGKKRRRDPSGEGRGSG